MDNVGVVVIGRNEGDRLVACLNSLGSKFGKIVYVDSNSDDGSVESAEELGAITVQLGSQANFTAARARNAGLRRLLEVSPNTIYVQFIDGDCELDSAWIHVAVGFLENNRQVGVAAGRRREKFPDRSIFNRLCDLEWNTDVGNASACGGDFMARVEAIESVGGFNADLIAGEEPELCHRLRKKGWLIYRIDADMTRHDAAIYRITQWIKRSTRAGYAYASSGALHCWDGRRFLLRENLSILTWAALVPFACGLLSFLAWPWGLFSFAIFPIQLARMTIKGLAKHDFATAMPYAFFNLLGKWPEFLGQLRFVIDAVGGFQKRIIEYK